MEINKSSRIREVEEKSKKKNCKNEEQNGFGTINFTVKK